MTKECEWCEKIMDGSNMKRHLKSCVFYSELKATKADVIYLLKKKPRDEVDRKEEITFGELKHFLTENYNKAMLLYNKILHDDGRSPEEKIKEMNVSAATMENYLLEWRLFNRWLKKNKRMFSAETANSYIATLKNRASTIRKKHNTLQLLLQHLIDRNVRLNRFRMRISYLPKKALSEREVQAYLEEQKGINSEDYLIQLLLCTYGLRINTIALLKVRDLEFLDADKDEEHMIHLPDSKVKNRRLEPIGKELEGQLRKFIRGDSDGDNYVFFKGGKNLTRKVRAQNLCLRINKRIKNSKVLKKSENYKYSSHMFRKTKAYNMYHQEKELLKDRVRSSIGQSQGSTAIMHYIN